MGTLGCPPLAFAKAKKGFLLLLQLFVLGAVRPRGPSPGQTLSSRPCPIPWSSHPRAFPAMCHRGVGRTPLGFWLYADG